MARQMTRRQNRLAVLLLMLVGLFLASAALGERPQNAGEASLRLKQGMSEKDVVAAMESYPNSSSLTTCGKSGSHWQCKIWKYEGGNSGEHLLIFFAQSPQTGAWIVNSWITF